MRADEWNSRWFGYWGGRSSAGALPAVDDFVDPGWNPPDKRQIIRYLERAPEMLTQAESATCLMCGCDVGNCSDNRSDGVWVWPADLAHYVRKHSVALPAAFVDHVRKQKYRLPASDAVDWNSLDWPKLVVGQKK